MTALVLRGDARNLPLADNSVDLIVTSPPYFALRSYTDGGEHYAGQVGDEPNPQAFLESLWACTAEWLRVLKPSGSLWVNLGDKYAGAPSGPRSPRPDGYLRDSDSKQFLSRRSAAADVPAKSLMGLPWRYALGCIDQLGLILRAEVIWSKPNGLPESVTDRVRRSHEQWFHFTPSPIYFSAVDMIREQVPTRKGAMTWAERKHAGEPSRRGEQGANDATIDGMAPHPLGALPSSVWSIPTQPLQVPDSLGIDHFAAFPMEWPRRIIRGWSPAGICTACGEGRRPVVESQRCVDGQPVEGMGARKVGGYQSEASGIGNWRYSTQRARAGESCACAEPTAPTRPSVVLDPFGGTGTTALVASALGRTGISVDLSYDYCRLARWRTTDRRQIAAAMQVAKPEPEIDGQADLFSDLSA